MANIPADRVLEFSAAGAPVTDHPAQTYAPAVSRRGLFAGLALAAGAAASVVPVRRASAAPPVGAPIDIDPGAAIVRLVSRSTFGVNSAELARAAQLGYSGYLEEQLNPSGLDDSALESRIAVGVGTQGQSGYIAPLTTLVMTGQQLFDTAVVSNTATPRDELIDATILRAVYSKKQLLQRMVEFWGDHFSLPNSEEPLRQLRIAFDRDVIRPHALGSFPAMLTASATSAAMMDYLTNDQNRASSINENYAREIMELHTVGVSAGYTQDDIVKIARCFTGWTWWSASSSGVNRGTFRYDSTGHDTNAKVFSGSGVFPANWTIPSRFPTLGQQDGFDVINYLAAHPETAAYIAKKLCVKFLGPSVPQSVIDAVAQIYLNASNPMGIGDIKAMMRYILQPALVVASPMLYKRPFHLAVSSMRIAPTTIFSGSGIRSNLSSMGHLPFAWQEPDGYPDTTIYWSGLQLPRWNWAARLPTAGVSSTTMDVTSTVAGLLTGATTAAQVMNIIDQQVFLNEMPASERTRLLAYLPPSGAPSTTIRQETLGLALSAPGFQWY
jgi:uncharacterized protein (DUF1800 family)